VDIGCLSIVRTLVREDGPYTRSWYSGQYLLIDGFRLLTCLYVESTWSTRCRKFHYQLTSLLFFAIRLLIKALPLTVRIRARKPCRRFCTLREGEYVSDRRRLPRRADVVEKSRRGEIVACCAGCADCDVRETILGRIGDDARARAEKDRVKCSIDDRGTAVCDELSRMAFVCDVEASDVGDLRSVLKALRPTMLALLASGIDCDIAPSTSNMM
jgi:hypothetical protein